MGLINVLREVTRITKLFPFFYTALLSLCWIVEANTSFEWVLIIDRYVYFSFIVSIFLIRLSYPLKFCNWYRFQCVLPLIQQVIETVDTYIYEFGEYIAIANEVIAYGVPAFTFINAYFVFIKPLSRR